MYEKQNMKKCPLLCPENRWSWNVFFFGGP